MLFVCTGNLCRSPSAAQLLAARLAEKTAIKEATKHTFENIAELWRQSPIAYFDQVETPMLIIHSEGDLRCNVAQSEQVFTALQQRGIESRFIRYPQSTFHGMSRSGPPDLRIHRLHEILKWWKKHLAN